MGIGISVFLMAAGAILAFAVDVPTNGIDFGVVGVILMLLGGVGLLATMVLWNDWDPARRREEAELYEDFGREGDILVRRARARRSEGPVVDDGPAIHEEPVVERRVTTRRVLYDR